MQQESIVRGNCKGYICVNLTLDEDDGVALSFHTHYFVWHSLFYSAVVLGSTHEDWLQLINLGDTSGVECEMCFCHFLT